MPLKLASPVCCSLTPSRVVGIPSKLPLPAIVYPQAAPSRKTTSVFAVPARDHDATPSKSLAVRSRVSVSTSIASESDTVEKEHDDDDSVAAFWDYQFLFISQRAETDEPVTLRVKSGAVPSDFPDGTYYLAGPGMFSDDHGSTVHPLDGHGYLRAFTFERGNGGVSARFMARYVRTQAKEEEHEAEGDTWRFEYRGPFSVLRGGRKVGNTKVMKNVANTSVLVWARRLMCLWEGGAPYELQAGPLDTLGSVDLAVDASETRAEEGDGGGVLAFAARLLKPILYGIFKMPPKRLLSHYKVDAQRNRLLTVACNAEDMLLPRNNFTFYEYDSNFKLLQKREFTIPDQMMIHDWAFTETYYIIFANRIKLDVPGAVTAVSGITPMITAITANPSKGTTPIYLLPRSGSSSRDWRVPVEAPSRLWLLHVANAHQRIEENGNLAIQVHAASCSYQWFNFHKLFGYDWRSGKLDPSVMNTNEGKNDVPHLIQVSITIDPNGHEKCDVEPLNQWENSADFPIINPKFSGLNNTHVYAAAASGSRRSLPHFPFDTVAKLNVLDKSVRTWSVDRRKFIGEPIFIPNGGADEDDGYLLVVEYAVSVQRCYLVILNPKKIGEEDAVEATLEIPKHLNFPLAFHGFWANADSK